MFHTITQFFQKLAWALALVAGLSQCALAQVGIEQVEPGNIPLDEMDQPAITGLAPCGTDPVSIARMQWPSAAILAEIHALIIEAAYGCNVDVVAGDNTATISSMASTAQPAVAPELWISRAADTWNLARDTQNVRNVGPAYAEEAFEGWFVPDYVVQNNPELKTAAQLIDFWQVFAANDQRARLVSCPPEWGCAILNRNLLRAFGLSARFEIVEPESRFELDRMIADAVSRNEPLLFYYWQPNAILAQLDFVQLEFPGYDPEKIACLATRDCPNPQPGAFPQEPVIIAVAEWVFEKAPSVALYFQRAQMPLREMNALLAWQNEQGASPAETAAHFYDTRPGIWRRWTGDL